MHFEISIPKGLSILANHDMDSFVPGISDLIRGVSINAQGDTVNTVSYADRIKIGKQSHEALRRYDVARASGDRQGMESAEKDLRSTYEYFGYGYFDSVDEAIPPVALTFYMFRVMVIIGGYLLAFFILVLFAAYRTKWLDKSMWLQFLGIFTIPLVYLCSQAGWVVAEVGRQPWTVQNLLPTRAAISNIASSTVMITFWMFVIIFTVLLVAEISIMCNQIKKASKRNLEGA